MEESRRGETVTEKKLYLIDGTNQIFRAFYAIKSQLTNREGLPTNALFGFTRMLKKLLSEKDPAYIATAFDMAAPTFRHEEYEDYKANRPEPPEDLSVQFPYARKICEALGIPVIEKEGFEADDIIGTLAERAKEQGFSVIIVASDKDLFQLVDEMVMLLNPQKEIQEFDSEGVMKTFGVPPEHVVDVIGLWGDAIDNIPGVPGIGEKKAKEIISLYGSLDDAVRRAERFLSFFRVRDEILQAIDDVETASSERLGKTAVSCIEKLHDLEREGNELIKIEKDAILRKRLEELLASAASIRMEKETLLRGQKESIKRFKLLKKELRNIEKGSSLKSWESLAQNKEAAFVSRKLARIERNVPIDVDTDALRYQGPKEEQMHALFSDLGFSSLLEDMGARKAIQEEIPCKLMSSAEEAEQLEETLLKKREAFFSLFRATKHPNGARILMLSFYMPEQHETYAAILYTGDEEKKEQHLVRRIGRILENERIRKIGYDLKDSIRALEERGIVLKGLFFDLKLAAYLLDPSGGDLRFSAIVKRILKEDIQEEEHAKKDEAPDEAEMIRKCCKRALYTARLFAPLQEKIVQENLEELFETLELPLIEVLAAMESAGVKIDSALLKTMSGEMEADLGRVVEEIYACAGERFNINSPKQLGEILFEKIGLQHGKKTPKSKAYATGMDVLAELSRQHPLPGKILEYRSIAKIKSTYVDALPALIDERTGRVHTSFNNTGTATGRLSSSDPNLQNIPVRTEAGRMIRKAFIPDEGNLFLSADYSQVELRILAHLSDDQEMIESFMKGEDIHRTTASKMLGIPYEKVTEQYRRFAKTINFGIIYGMSAFRLSKELGISGSEAKKFIESYFRRFRRVKEYIDETTTFVQKEGYVTTLFGRVRNFKEIRSPNRTVVQQAIRQAVNTTIQGTAADLIKKAMIAIHGELKQYDARMVLQVHDELLLEVPEDMIEALQEMVKEKMEGVYMLKVPLIVNIAAGKNWADAK